MPVTIAKLTKKLMPASKVTVDYPQQNEKINSPRYTIRVGTQGGAKNAEVSINQGPWMACRQAVGFWWYDWSGYKEGEQEVTARAKTQDGKTLVSATREFFVVPQGKKK